MSLESNYTGDIGIQNSTGLCLQNLTSCILDATSELGTTPPGVIRRNQTVVNQMIARRIMASILPVLHLTPTCRAYHVTMSVGLSGSLVLLGLAGNFLSCVVLLKQKRSTLNTSMNILLVVLSVLDSLLLLILLLIKIIPSLCGLLVCMDYLEFFSSYLMVSLLPVSATTLILNEYIVVLIALHRYLFVCHNGLARKLCTIRLTLVQILALFVLSVLYSFPRFLEYRLVYFPPLGRKILRPTALKQNELYNRWYTQFSAFIVVYTIPLTVLGVVTSKLVLFLRQAQKRANLISKNNTKKNEEETTVSLTAIVAVFCFTQIHNPIRRTLELVIPSEKHGCPHFLFYYYEVVVLMNVVNYSTNFVLYFLFNRRFRAQVRAFLWRRSAAVAPAVSTASTLSASVSAAHAQMRSNETVQATVSEV